MNILDVTERVNFDNSLVNNQKHSHHPLASTTYDNNDEIRIQVSQSDIFTLPCESHLYVMGKIITDTNKKPTTAKLVSNFFAHLFEEIRIEANGQVLDRVRGPGVTTTLKSLISLNGNEARRLQNAGWDINNNSTYSTDTSGNFDICIPLSILLGFFEDFKKILLNVKLDLVLVRSNSDHNAIINSTTSENVKVVIEKITWRLPHISVGDAEKLELLKYIENGVDLDIAFRSWELHEFPLLNKVQQHTWTIKSSTHLEKPRYAIVAFSTERKNKADKNFSMFDNCKLSNMKLFLNSEMYPYDNLNINFDKNQIATLYDMYAQFQSSYYERENEPLLSIDEFKKIAPIVVIDCSKQNDELNTGSIEIRLEFQNTSNIPENTAAFCLLLHDRLIRYNPLTGIIHTV